MLNDKENEVKRLRRCVSRRVDDGVFAQFAVAHQAGLDDYAFMRRLPDAAALRAKLCVSGAESDYAFMRRLPDAAALRAKL